ncbi:MAG: hypothetical protein DMF99_25800 [Acidobacteria bacterium]|nr:MAG: hypothetical protein DMG03_05165 [Acidobacteriota bacterium]PYR06571.1 MAG: hypothetical protein DMF99_25800 [Acidobacteriota bacterium]
MGREPHSARPCGGSPLAQHGGARSRPEDAAAREVSSPQYWIVDPAKNTLEIYVLRDHDYVLFGSYDEAQDVNSPSLPGLAFAAARVFAE